MTVEPWTAAVAAAGAGGLLLWWRAWSTRQRALERMRPAEGEAEDLEAQAQAQIDESASRVVHEPVSSVNWVLPLLVGFPVGVALPWLLGLPIFVGVGGGALAAATTTIALLTYQERERGRVELQLAEALDLIVGALRAGTSLPEALRIASVEVRAPLGPELGRLVERLRLGEDPEQVILGLSRQFYSEPFQLFTTALGAHWESGGSLASSLALVGRTIRDRTALSRRTRSQAVESRLSALGVLAVTYLLAVSSWRSDPARMEQFLDTTLGGAMVGFVVLLQAAGLFWMDRMARIQP